MNLKKSVKVLLLNCPNNEMKLKQKPFQNCFETVLFQFQFVLCGQFYGWGDFRSIFFARSTATSGGKSPATAPAVCRPVSDCR